MKSLLVVGLFLCAAEIVRAQSCAVFVPNQPLTIAGFVAFHDDVLPILHPRRFIINYFTPFRVMCSLTQSPVAVRARRRPQSLELACAAGAGNLVAVSDAERPDTSICRGGDH